MELQNDQSFETAASCRRCSIRCIGDFKMPGWPVRVDGKPPSLKRRLRCLGEHTGEVLGNWLGMTEAEVEALRAEGAL